MLSVPGFALLGVGGEVGVWGRRMVGREELAASGWRLGWRLPQVGMGSPR